MKKKLLLALFFCAAFFASHAYIPLTVSTGFNTDAIANGVGTGLVTTTGDVDGANYCYVSNGWQLTSASTPITTGLPATGLINSAVTTGLTYQLGNYSANNDLRLATNTSGTLAFTTPYYAAQTLYILAVTGSGSSVMDVTITFTDATTQTQTGIAVADWYGGTGVAITGFQRMNRTNNLLDNAFNGPNLYQYSIAILAANQTKQIASITVTRTSGSGTTTCLNIFAVSIQESASCPAPTALTATPTATTASLNWTQAGTASNWQIKYGAAGFNPSTAGTAIVTSTRPYTLNPPLTTLTNYDYYVRAICGPGDTSAYSLVKSFTTLCAAPSLTSTKDSSRCGTGTVVLQATAPSTATINWYAAATGGTPLSTGSSFTTPSISTTTTYYAAAASGSGGVTNGNIATITGGINGCGGGVMFNITPTVNITVDSFLNLSNLSQTTTVTVYYKTGTFLGSELLPANWTTLGTTTVTTVSGTMTPIKVPGQSIPMTAGTTYGIYIANMSNGYTDGTGPNQTYTNADLTLNAGSGLCGVFTGSNNPRVFNGTVYYHKGSACESARTPVIATVKTMPVVDLGNDTTICPGITYTLNAGNAGAAYSWNTGASTQSVTVNAAGTYSVLVTSPNGCFSSDAKIITPGIVPVNNLPATTNLCAGETASLNAGNSGSSFVWTPGGATTQTINVTTGGNRSVNIKSTTGCQITSATNVIIRPNPVPALGNDTSICDGATITLNAGNAGYAYLWNTGATTQTVAASDSGTYTVTVTSPYNCVRTEDKHIAYLPSPRTEGFNFIPLFYQQLGKVEFSPLNPTNVNTYEWDFGDGSPHSTQMNPTHIFNGTGQFIVTLKVFNGCGDFSISLPINVNLTTGIVTLSKEYADVTIYPNPSNAVVNIDNKASDVKMQKVMVFNTLGAMVYQSKADSDKSHRMHVDGFASGIYSVRILTDKGFIIRKFEVIK